MNLYSHNLKSILELTENDSLILSSSSESKINKDQRYFKYLRKSHNLKKILDIVRTTFNHYFNIIIINHRFNIEYSNIITLLENGIKGLNNFLSYYKTLKNEYPTYDVYCNSYNQLKETIEFVTNKLDNVKNIIETEHDIEQETDESEHESEHETDYDTEHETEYEIENNILYYVKDIVVSFFVTLSSYIKSFFDIIIQN